MAYFYSLSMKRNVFKQKVALDNLSDDELYGSTRFPWVQFSKLHKNFLIFF